MDLELKGYLEKFDQRLQAIQYKKEGMLRAFFRGIMSGLGYIAGFVLALVIIGFILNVIGVIPAFRQQAREWQQTLEQIKRVR